MSERDLQRFRHFLLDAPELSSEKRLGKYRLVREVGRGGMGIVYEAMDPDLGRTIALKVLNEEEAGSEAVKRLHREAAVAGRLKHPHIVKVHEVGMAERIHFIAMDFVEGPTLAKRMEEKTLPIPEAVTILKRVSEAIAYAHAEGVVHRDLKPSNIILDPNRGPIVTDFGLAREWGNGTTLTETGASVGTPHYMAPERVMGKEVGPAADTYALGVMLYEALTGRRPFEGATLMELQRSILNEEPVPPRRIRREIDQDLETICLKGMGKSISWRYASCGELGDDLDRYLKGEPVRARPVGWPVRVYRRIRRKGHFAAAVGIAVVLALIALGFGASTVVDRLKRQSIRKKNTSLYLEAETIGKRFQEELRAEPHDIRPSRRKLERAFGLLERCLKEDPDDAEARLLKGQIHVHLDDLNAAEEEFSRVIRDEPTFLKAFVARMTLMILRFSYLQRDLDEGKVDITRLDVLRKEILSDVRSALALGADPLVQEYCDTCLDYFSGRRGAQESLDRCDRNILSGRMPIDFSCLSLAVLCHELETQYPDNLTMKQAIIPRILARAERFRRLVPMRLDIYHVLLIWYKTAERLLPAEQRQEHPTAVLRLLDDWLTIDPDFSDGYVWRAEWYQGQGRFEEAQWNYARAIELAPGDVAPYSARAAMYVDHYRELDPRGERAKRDLEEAFRRNPRQWALYHTRYRLRFRQGRYEEALEDISRALELSRALEEPAYWLAGYVLWARVLNRLSRTDEAIAHASRVIEYDSPLDGALAFEERATAYWMKREFDKSLEDCAHLLQKNPASWVGRMVRGNIYVELKRFEEAIEDAEAFQELVPNSVDARMLKAKAYEGLERVDDAVLELEAAMEILPPDHPRRKAIQEELVRLRARPR